MRILIANCYFAPAWGYGGPTRLLYELAGRLSACGHQVTVITSDASDGAGRYAGADSLEDNVRVVRCKTVSQYLAFQCKQFIAPAYPGEMRRHIDKADIVHLSGSRDYFTTFGAALARQCRRPYVLAAYGTLPATGPGWRGMVKPYFDRLITRRTVQHAAACLAQTQHEAAVYTEFGVSLQRIHLTPLASDGDRFRQLPQRGSFRARMGLTGKHRVLLFVGRIHPLKGLDILIDALAIACKFEPLLRLVVVGRDDGHEAFLRSRIQSIGLHGIVLWAGPLYGADVVKAYVDADAFILTPRHFEETSLAGVEACFCGSQAIVTEEAEIPHLVEYGAGAMVKNDVREIAAAILAAVADDGTIQNRGRAAREMAFAEFEWSKVLRRYVSVYERALTLQTSAVH